MNENWPQLFFDNLYLELFMKRSPEQIQEEVNIIKELVKDKKITSLMDVCCGIADISAQLEKDLSIIATGIEYSKDYVKKSQIKNIIEGDACILQNSFKYSLVLNWFSSFAYFSPEKNKELLRNCFNYCDNLFLLESYNPYAVLASFQEEFNYDKIYNNKNYKIKRKCRIDVKTRMLCQSWFFISEDQERIHNTQSYLYFPDEIYDILKEIGFKDIEIIGRDKNKLTSLTLHTPRLIIKAKR